MRWPLLFLIGCSTPSEPPALGASLARVGTQTIAASEVESLVRVTGVTPRDALRDLVSERLLVGHAQPYESSAAVRRGVAQAAVQRLLAQEIGPGDPDAQRAKLEALLARLRSAAKVQYQQETIARAFAQ